MEKLRCTAILMTGLIALCGSARPLFDSSFLNTGKSDEELAHCSWKSLAAYADGRVQPAALPALGVQVADYVFFAPKLNRQLAHAGPALIWTDVPDIDLESLKQLQVSIKADGAAGDPAKARFAMKTGGRWIVSNWQYSSDIENRGFIPVSLSLDDWGNGANWRMLKVQPGAAGQLRLEARVLAGRISGTVSELGLFVENGNKGDHFRFNAFQAMDSRSDADHSDPIVAAMLRAKKYQEGQPDSRHYNWLTGAFYSGVFACYKATGEDEFLDAARKWCVSAEWTLRDGHYLNADAICTAQTFLDLYFIDQDPKQIEQINGIFETYYFDAETIDRNLMGRPIWKEPFRPFIGRNLWWWCDALYMAPPLLARLGKATGNPQYYELLHRLYWDASDFLYRENEQLFLRDQHFFQKKTPAGKPVFWGRGNGWVIGGLVRTLDYIPEDDPMRPRYINLFQEMMARIVTLQGDDGLWRSSLNEPEWFPMPESSGSSFFTFGLAAGINRGWLDRDTYLPAAKKAWAGLAGILSPEGKVQWSQPVADHPFETKQEDTRSYTQGAFLLAASEIYKLECSNNKDAVPSNGVADTPRTFCRFVPERSDDFAWENDKVAFRAYGPALRSGAENSGIDCWLKRVEYPIIDKWYGQMNEKTYHKDWGEGFDPYHVGSSAGCGGTGIWLDGRREPLETYTKQEVIECTPERSQFTLTYECEIRGDVYGEEKTVTIEPGKRLFDVRSVFTKNGKAAAGLPVCIGLTTHDGRAEPFSNEKQGWIACWETMADGELGTAARMNPARITEIREVKDEKKDESHIFIITQADDRGAVEFSAGCGWAKAGEIKTSSDWKNYLNTME